MKQLIFLALTFATLISCQNNKNVYQNDFDQLADWGYTSPMLKSEGAHSGIYYCSLDSTCPYSLTFSRPLKNFDITNINSITLSAWVRVKKIPSSGVMVVTIDSPTGPVKYMGISLKDEVFNANEWTEIKQTFQDIPKGLDLNNVLKVYMNNTAKESLDIDDVQFELE